MGESKTGSNTSIGVVDADKLQRLGVKKATAVRWAPTISAALKAGNVSEPRQVAAFLANALVESGMLEKLVENLNYKADALVSLFGSKRIDMDTAKKVGRIEGLKKQPANPEAIANIIYGGAWGMRNLGNTEAGDGWKFRGRGLFQLTGKANYTRFGKMIGKSADDLTTLLEQDEPAAASAEQFFVATACRDQAAADDITGVRKTINGGTNGLDEVSVLYEKAKKILGAA